MTVTKTAPFSGQATLSGAVSKTIGVTWSGTLQSARLGGVLRANYGPGLCDLKGAVRVNGIEVGTFDMAAVSYGYAEGAFSFEIGSYMAQGSNVFDFFLWCSYGWVPFLWIGVDGTLTVTADDVSVVVPPSTQDVIFYLVAGIVVVAGVASTAYLIRELKRK
jgi:hypothetical protein